MENILNVIGIDVSKLKLDACHYQSLKMQTFSNDSKGFSKFSRWIATLSKQGECLVCFENTGYYSLSLAIFLQQQQIRFSMISPIQIKRSLGLVRGKSDTLDAYQIARYGWLYREELEASAIPAKLIIELSQLLSMRDQFIKQKVALQNMLEAFEQTPEVASKEAVRLIGQQIKQLEQQILKGQKALENLLNESALKPNYLLLRTIKGVGLILAAQIIAHTNNFASFTEWRRFACYAGLAPFEHTSGTSLKGKTKVHPIADKKLKSLFTMAAISAIQHDPELKLYYKRKLETGKNKMSIINAVKCKLVSRAFAVVKRQSPFVMLQTFAT